MRLGELVRLGCVHDIIRTLTADPMCHAWSLLPQSDLKLSPTEYFRVCRAFYRVELLFDLFRSDPETASAGIEKRLFLSRHPPWENEQLGCVHDFLEKKLSDGRHVLDSKATVIKSC